MSFLFILKKPRSIAPTVEAFWAKIFKAFQFVLIKLFLNKNFFKLSNIYWPDFNSNADSPIIISGFFDTLCSANVDPRKKTCFGHLECFFLVS